MTDFCAPPGLSHTIDVAPEFYDVDAMEIVWHGHYVKYLERARSALLGRLGYGYLEMRASGFAWPIVDMRLKYVAPAFFGQALKVKATIVEWETRLRIEYLVTDAASGRKLNVAHTVQVAVDMATREMRYVCPAVLWEKLGVGA